MLLVKSLLIGDSPEITSVLNTIARVAHSDSTVLITGESGTGKELVARSIHENSNRAKAPLVVVNCGAIPGELLEAELFGHTKGAFTGATQARIGRFELAHGGTLFLDEVGDLPLHLQVKLLRVLQTKSFEPIGSSKTVSVDVRIIAATNVNLEDAVQNKQFREDLYYRLNVIPVKLPALRERRSDIPKMVYHFISHFNRLTGHEVAPPTGQIMDALLAYQWPGNVRELENTIERLVILKGKGNVELGDLPQKVVRNYLNNEGQGSGAVSAADPDFPRMSLPENGLDLKTIVANFENHLIDQALSRTHNNKNKASELLQMNRTTLVEKLRKRGMITPAKNSKAALAAAASMGSGAIANTDSIASSIIKNHE